MRIKVEVDISVATRLIELVTRKLPYAINNSLTRLAKEMVAAGQQEIAKDFTVRKRFIQTRVRILQYSKVGNLTTIVGIDPRVQGSPLLLGFFEEGGEKKSAAGGSSLAVPITGTPVRPTFEDPVKNALKYSNLQIQNRKGKQRTYVVAGIGIFERIAPGNAPESTVLIYKFETSAHLGKHMNMIGVMVFVVQERWAAIFAEEFEKEITALRP